MNCSLENENALRARGFSLVAGIDEAGRGPLAGPVVAAAVVLPGDYHHDVLRDSKQLTSIQREHLYEELLTRTDVHWAVAIVTHHEVANLNFLRATHKARRPAPSQHPAAPDHVLIDGLPVRPFPIKQTALVGGDGLS